MPPKKTNLVICACCKALVSRSTEWRHRTQQRQGRAEFPHDFAGPTPSSSKRKLASVAEGPSKSRRLAKKNDEDVEKDNSYTVGTRISSFTLQEMTYFYN
jgi:hypothetical protein